MALATSIAQRPIARAGGGTNWGELDDATQRHGLAVTGGRVPSTGIGGLTLGSGSHTLAPSMPGNRASARYSEPNATYWSVSAMTAGLQAIGSRTTPSRPRARIEYLANLERTASMPLQLLLTGHGDPVHDHAGLVRRRFSEHRRRCRRILDVLEQGPTQAYGIAGHLWSARTVAEQPLLVVWEVLGHLDLLLDDGRVSEQKTDDGSRYGKAWFSLPERSPARHDPNDGLRETSILYPGGDRSAKFE